MGRDSNQMQISALPIAESLMPDTFIVPIALFLLITAWTALVHYRRHFESRQRQEIVRRGASCEGRIVGILRPSVVDTCTRLYFEFVPPGADRPLRVCHIDNSPAEHSRATLFRPGQLVLVRYLPEQPTSAIISNLL
jgi:hypothetical protein